MPQFISGGMSPFEAGGYKAGATGVVVTDLCLAGEALVRLRKAVAFGMASAIQPYGNIGDGDVEFFVSTCLYNGTAATEAGYRAFPAASAVAPDYLEMLVAPHIQTTTARAASRAVWEGSYDVGSFKTFKSHFNCQPGATADVSWTCEL